MKTIEDIRYEINFIENELKNKDFTYLKVNDLENWLMALRWTLKEGEEE